MKKIVNYSTMLGLIAFLAATQVYGQAAGGMGGGASGSTSSGGTSSGSSAGSTSGSASSSGGNSSGGSANASGGTPGVTPGGGNGVNVPNTDPGMPGNPKGSATNAIPPSNIAPSIPPTTQH
jgi:hypothetical protein